MFADIIGRMAKNLVEDVVNYIVNSAIKLKNRYTNEVNALIDWVAIFTQSDEEYIDFLKKASSFGEVIQDTETGPIFKLNRPIKTRAGELFIIKIRKPDKTRPQRGDGDFRLSDYETFKKRNLTDKHFKLIRRKDYEMIELKDSEFDVLVYFSNPPISEVLGLS